jgi:dTDP-L-rhamnose 4-epimerase
VLNVGSGTSVTVLELAERLAALMGVDVRPETTGRYRIGDIRHCFADISLARELLGYEPRVPLEQGMAELVEWLAGQAAVDRVDAAAAELSSRGLTL